VDNRFGGVIGLEAALGGIGDRAGFMNQHVVPRLVPVGLGLVGLIPLLVGRALGVKRDHHAAILITHMAHQIARRKLGWCAILQIWSQHDHGK